MLCAVRDAEIEPLITVKLGYNDMKGVGYILCRVKLVLF